MVLLEPDCNNMYDMEYINCNSDNIIILIKELTTENEVYKPVFIYTNDDKNRVRGIFRKNDDIINLLIDKYGLEI